MGTDCYEMAIDPRVVKAASVIVLLGFLAVVVLIVVGLAKYVGVI